MIPNKTSYRHRNPSLFLTFHGPIKPTDTIIRFRTGPIIKVGDVLMFDDTEELVGVILNHENMEVERGFNGTEILPLFGPVIDAVNVGTTEKYCR